MELKKLRCYRSEKVCEKPNVVVGKWYYFPGPCEGNLSNYGKVVEILEDGYVMVEKYFQAPNYSANMNKWYYNLDGAVLDF